jgi:hypothetical protein
MTQAHMVPAHLRNFSLPTNIYTNPTTITQDKPQPPESFRMPATSSFEGSNSIIFPTYSTSNPQQITTHPHSISSMHQKKIYKAAQKQVFASDSHSSSSSDSDTARVVNNNTATTTTTAIPVVVVTKQEVAHPNILSSPSLSNNSSEEAKTTPRRKRSSSSGSKQSSEKNEPTLSFTKQQNVTNDFVFKCMQGFIPNNSKKSPPDTDFYVTIRDALFIASPNFGKCISELKLKDGSSNGVTVSKDSFKPNNSNNSTTFECNVIIPQ